MNNHFLGIYVFIVRNASPALPFPLFLLRFSNDPSSHQPKIPTIEVADMGMGEVISLMSSCFRTKLWGMESYTATISTVTSTFSPEAMAITCVWVIYPVAVNVT